MMELGTFRRLVGSVKVLAAVIGAGIVVTMGAITIAHGDDEVTTKTASINGLPLPSVKPTAAPTELATSFARPTYTATPCAKRATMPC
jgi:hypothetical protein